MIVVKGLTKYLESTAVLNNISFSLSAGDAMTVKGASGSGKTTLLRLIAGLDRPDLGEIYINNRCVSDARRIVPPHQRSIGFVFQEPALWPHFTVAQNILFGLKHFGRRTAREKLSGILDTVGLTGLEKRYPDELSGGEARRVAIARALAPEPACLLMDEPLVNLDADLKERLLRLITEITVRRCVTMIYVTHDGQEADRIAKHRFHLHKGSLRKLHD